MKLNLNNNIYINWIFALVHCVGFSGLLNLILNKFQFHGTVLTPALWIFVAIPLHMIYLQVLKFNKKE
jgi:hypothetical protein